MIICLLGFVKREGLHHAVHTTRVGERHTSLTVDGSARRPAAEGETSGNHWGWLRDTVRVRNLDERRLSRTQIDCRVLGHESQAEKGAIDGKCRNKFLDHFRARSSNHDDLGTAYLVSRPTYKKGK